MTGTEIITKILSYSGLNGNSFSEKIGLNRPQAIYDIQRGKTMNISPKMADKIISVFPELNRTWLLTGEGEMLKGESPKMPDNQEKNAEDNINIPVNVLKTMEEQAASLRAQSETMRSLSESVKTRDRQIDRMLSMLEELQQRAFSGDFTRSIDIRADLDA